MPLKIAIFFSLLFLSSLNEAAFSQSAGFTAIEAEVDFSKKIRDWDGFGFNYVEAAQTLDYENAPQEYGGFSLLNDQQKKEIIEYVFGNDGLKPGLVKMFLDPYHQAQPGGAFDHTTTTENMRYFVKQGYAKTREGGRDFTIITTMYGPPAWATRQKQIRGRDLDPAQKENLARYMIDWAKFLRNQEGLPVKYISLHNEGEDWMRWETDGVTHEANNIGHDYNLYWPPNQIVDFLTFMPDMLKKEGMADVKLTPGETYSWDKFFKWGIPYAIADKPQALKNLGLITSHGFLSFGYGRWNSKHISAGTDVLREKRPELHAWVTSTSWKNMDAEFVAEIYSNIYYSKVNGLIPWAGIQQPSKWYGSQGDPNPGCAIWVKPDGSYELRKGYYYYKQASAAGQPGMAVVRTQAQESEISIIGFSANGTKNPDAMIIVNVGPDARTLHLEVKGSKAKSFKAFRTSEGNRRQNLAVERHSPAGTYKAEKGKIVYECPAKSVTTFYAE